MNTRTNQSRTVNQRVVVTGGAGFIGSHLVEALVGAGVGDIAVVDNLRRGNLAFLTNVSGDIRFVEGDVRSRDLLHELLEGADVVYHLAAQSNVLGAEEDALYAFTTNVVGTFNVLDVARDRHVPRVVFTSSREVYGDPDRLPVPESALLKPKNAYGTSKAAGELYCNQYRRLGLDVRVLRLANVYGPRDHGRVIPIFIEQALRQQPLTIYGGEQILDFVWVEDVVSALVQAGVCPPFEEPVNIGNGHGTTIAELAERVQVATGSAAPVIRLPTRTVEVSRFVAETSRARQLFQLPSSADSLGHLDQLVAWFRRRA